MTDETSQTKAITVRAEPQALAPTMSVDDAAQHYATLLDARRKLLRPEKDVITVKGPNGKPMEYVRKSGWRRLARMFGVSTKTVEVREEHPNGGCEFVCQAVAVAPNGDQVVAEGSCGSDENRNRPRHAMRAMAETRAKNRAISDLIGGGEVSAEEMEGVKDSERLSEYASMREILGFVRHPNFPDTRQKLGMILRMHGFQMDEPPTSESVDGAVRHLDAKARKVEDESTKISHPADDNQPQALEEESKRSIVDDIVLDREIGSIETACTSLNIAHPHRDDLVGWLFDQSVDTLQAILDTLMGGE